MFTLNFNPTLFDFGIVKIRWYGLIFALGFIVYYLYLNHIVKKSIIENFNKENIDAYFMYMIVCIIAGARLFYSLFYDFAATLADPLELFKVWHGGLSFHGGLSGFVLGSIVFCKKHKINSWQLLDVSAVAAIFALMLGRIGNLINGELAGTPFAGSWCAVFPNYDNVCRHPYPIYAFASHFALLLYLLFMVYRHRANIKEFVGSKQLTVNFLVGYGILRIITDIWKVDSVFWGMKTGQWLSLGMIVAGLWLFKKKNFKNKQKPNNFSF